ncbi:sigma-70 family RNA polymerase sigma factor [Oscillibacter sp.]|uniref:sigma-70 family RNA polymerase sigma factor n=1 Tax=Oscillibacter sp. TaxID=1945593 RepID=UPI0028A2525A|nr:sigma-70 family RNA polymerase sigma factor [Oscillibacter sp.]
MVINKHEYAKRIQTGRIKLYRTAFCYVKNEQDALDIVGEATCKGLESLHQLRQPEYFDIWMTRIVINTALSFLRKKRLYAVCSTDTMEEIAVDEDTMHPEDTMDLYEALDVLDPLERTYVILRFFEDWPIREMADILQTPEPTVKSRLYRALKKMRKYLIA